MEQFVNEDAGKLGVGAIENDAALAQKRGGVNGMAVAAQAARAFDDERRSFNRRKAAQDGRHLRLMGAVPEMEERRVRHW
jgi:hypothetical protein